MVDVLKEPTDVGFDQKAELAVRQFEGQIAHRILGVSPRSIAVGAIEEVFCVDRPQQPGAGELHELVRQRRDAQWPFFSVLFGDVDAPHEFRPVAPRLHTLRQIGDMTVQVGRVSLRRQPIDAAGSSLVQAVPTVPQPFGIHLLEEVAKAMVFAPLRPMGYSPP